MKNYSNDLRFKLLPYIEMAAGSCRVAKSMVKMWSMIGNLEEVINRFKGYPGVNMILMEEEVIKRYRELTDELS